MQNIAEFKINPKFQNLLPRLSTEEIQTLRESIRSHGCLDPIIVWDGTIVDGHNRYSICAECNTPFNVFEIDFESEDDAIVWIIDNQSGRRNLTDGWKYDLALKKKEILLAKGREKMSERGHAGNESRWGETSGLSLNDKPDDADDSEVFKDEPHNTRETIAADLGWSTGKTAQADFVFKHGDEEVLQGVKDGSMTIGKAYKTVRDKVKTPDYKEAPSLERKAKPDMVLFPMEVNAFAVQVARKFKYEEVKRIIELLQDMTI